jgi:hypothetical protein
MNALNRSIIESKKSGYLSDLGLTHVKGVLHDIIGLADQLHVTVLDAIVHHLHKVTRTVFAHPITTRLAVRLCRDRLKDVLHRWPLCISMY